MLKYVLVVLVCCSVAFCQSPSIRLVDGFNVGGISNLSGNYWPIGSTPLYDWRLNDANQPLVCWFKTTVTPFDNQGNVLGVGGIQYTTSMAWHYDQWQYDQCSQYITAPAKGKTGKDGVGAFDITFVFAGYDKVSAEACFDIKLSGRDKKGQAQPYFGWLRPAGFWDTYSTWWACSCMNLSPYQVTQTKAASAPVEVQTQGSESLTETWWIHKSTGDEVATSIVPLPEVDPNGFEQYGTPYYVKFTMETSTPQPKIIQMLHGCDELGLDICTTMYCYLESLVGTTATYKSEFIVPIEQKSQERVYVDPNGVVYKFVYTKTVFTVGDWCEDNNDEKIQQFLMEWLTGYTVSDMNYDGVVNFKDWALFTNRYRCTLQ